MLPSVKAASRVGSPFQFESILKKDVFFGQKLKVKLDFWQIMCYHVLL